MTTISLASLATVTGGTSVLQPGATVDTLHPIVASRPELGLQPGATVDSTHPIIRVKPQPQLQPGATAGSIWQTRPGRR